MYDLLFIIAMLYLCSDTGIGKGEMEVVKLESEGGIQKKNIENLALAKHKRSIIQLERQEFEESSASSMLEQGQSHVDDTGVCSETTICPAPLCRQFWKAGNYIDTLASKATVQDGKSYLHVHPMFLHSNATSHQWAFGAIAELLDNAVDEIQNGATFVIVDKISNPRDGSPTLLIQDDGGGMDPEAMRHCMSFGYSDKKSKSTIGQYGNGFKTSTMRLGADVIVFSRHLSNSTLTQSIGLLSYTFLSRTGYDRIVVPMVDYEFNSVSDKLEIHPRSGKEHYMSNLSMLLQWSPYSTEAELLQQFDDIGPQGTKVVIYNLWFSDDGNAELDFERDPEDIHISVDIKKWGTKFASWREEHVANRLHSSLRVSYNAYVSTCALSILYLRLPETFRIILRGRLVEHHNLANDLKFPEFILYIPKCGGVKEGQVITTIGFVKEAPRVNVHGFSIYHKNRLILPFWPVVTYSSNRGRGVVGVLEANFVEPTHNKQGFERTSLFHRLEYFGHRSSSSRLRIQHVSKTTFATPRYSASALDRDKVEAQVIQIGKNVDRRRVAAATDSPDKGMAAWPKTVAVAAPMGIEEPMDNDLLAVGTVLSTDGNCNAPLVHGRGVHRVCLRGDKEFHEVEMLETLREGCVTDCVSELVGKEAADSVGLGPVLVGPVLDAEEGFMNTTKIKFYRCKLLDFGRDYHCGLIGYQVLRKTAVKGSKVRGLSTKRKEHNDLVEHENLKRRGVNSVDAEHGLETEPVINANQEASNLVKENRKLKETCREYERRKEEDDTKVTKLKKELAELKCKYQRLMAEATVLDIINEEENVKM
ncbi:protein MICRORCHIDIA 6-like [Euphorbia lathyris]|uniref:protein MICRORCHIDIA 6-like n=1 Tax=Euphorbia lathyris TaxID=212925 RepID=UPI00331413CF